MLQVQWFPPSGSGALPVVFDAGAYALTDVTGISATESAPVTQKSSSQVGTSLSGVTVDARTIGITLEIVVSSVSDLWVQRQALAAAMVFLPAKSGQFPSLGTLRFSRDGMADVDILAMPSGAPDIHILTDTFATVDITFYCPYPFFKDTVDTTALLQGSGGLQFPVQHPFSMPTYNLTAVVTNTGTVPAPPMIRFYGNCTTPRLTNSTTGDYIEITGNIPADGSYVEIQTDYGIKSITAVDASGNRTNAMSRLNLAGGSGMDVPLLPGANTVAFTAATNVSGFARIFWRQRFSGI